MVDCSESSVRRHKQHIEPNRRVRREWEVLTKDGEIQTLRSYAVEEQAPQISYTDLHESLSDFSWYSPDSSGPVSEVFCFADAQIGKAMEIGGGTEETIERIKESLSRAVNRYQETQPAEIVFVDGGDIIENCFNTPKQLATNDLSLPDQIQTARRIVLEILKILRPLAPKLTYIAVPSNHGEVRIGAKNAPWTSDADWGLHIQEAIQDVSEEYDLGITFVRPDELEETAVHDTVDGTRLAVTHGHQAGSQDSLKKWIMGQDHGRRPGWDADIWITNHFHNLRVTTIGNGRFAIGTTSIDPGSLWHSKRTGESSDPGITAFSVSGGKWENLSVL